MKISYNTETKHHKVDGKGTMILSKNKNGIEIDNLQNFEFNNLIIQGQHGKRGKLTQLLRASEWIYSKEIKTTKKISIHVLSGLIGASVGVILSFASKKV